MSVGEGGAWRSQPRDADTTTMTRQAMDHFNGFVTTDFMGSTLRHRPNKCKLYGQRKYSASVLSVSSSVGPSPRYPDAQPYGR